MPVVASTRACAFPLMKPLTSLTWKRPKSRPVPRKSKRTGSPKVIAPSATTVKKYPSGGLGRIPKSIPPPIFTGSIPNVARKFVA